MVKLSPLVRALLAAVVAAGTAALTLTSDGVSAQDCIIILLAGLGAFGIVPPQVGGTQEGVVNPTVKDPSGYALVEMAFALCLLLVGVGVLVYLT